MAALVMASLERPLRPDSPAIRSDDLLPVAMFERIRPKLHPAIVALRETRRCRLGPQVSLSFENRETVLWHIHEVIRIERRFAPRQIREEVRRYDCLVPRCGELRATLMVDGGSSSDGARLSQLVSSSRGAVSLRVGALRCRADCVEYDGPCESPVHYIRFPVAEAGITARDFLSNLVVLELSTEPRVVVTASPHLRDALATDLRVGGWLHEEAAE
ncbi:MAG: DUF3501 family protein [Myxococcota bacterium]